MIHEDWLYSNEMLWAIARDTLKWHENWYWATTKPNVVTVGLRRDIVQRRWRESMQSVRLVEPGTDVVRDQSLGTAVNGAGEEHALPSPVVGKVVAINSAVIEDAEDVVTSPLKSGWLAKIEVAGPDALEGLTPYPEFSHPKPFASEDAERQYFKKALAENAGEGKGLVDVAVATRLGLSFVIARVIKLGLVTPKR